jgi:hypothetical protein
VFAICLFVFLTVAPGAFASTPSLAEAPGWLLPLGLAGGAVGGAAAWLIQRQRRREHEEALRSRPKHWETVDEDRAPISVPGTSVGQSVVVSVFAPREAPPREIILLQVLLHTPKQKSAAVAGATTNDPGAVEVGTRPSLDLRVRRDDTVRVTLSCADARIAEPVKSAIWNGRWVNLQFEIELPDAPLKRTLRPLLTFFVNGCPAGDLRPTLYVVPNARDASPSYVNEEARAFRKAFLSYASPDRPAVCRVAQALPATGTQYFQDVLSLEPGERWERRLYQEIDGCDVFMLFWSRHARESQWVIKEAEYALARQQQPRIFPYLLEQPPPIPPASLSEIHFNDPVSSIIFAEDVLAEARATQQAELDALVSTVDTVWKTARGKVARFRDGRAISCVEREWRCFESLVRYREFYYDGSPEVINNAAERRQFCDEMRQAGAKVLAEIRAKQKAEFDALASTVDTVWKTARGKVACCESGRAISCIEGEWRYFESLPRYREFYSDHNSWEELNDVADRRQFCDEMRQAAARIRRTVVPG